jgi:hypothetical protein
VQPLAGSSLLAAQYQTFDERATILCALFVLRDIF